MTTGGFGQKNFRTGRPLPKIVKNAPKRALSDVIIAQGRGFYPPFFEKILALFPRIFAKKAGRLLLILYQRTPFAPGAFWPLA